MRILMVTGIFPPDIGGPATSVPLLAEGLLGRGHQVAVLTLGDAAAPAVRFSYPVHRLRRAQPRGLRWARTVRAIVGAGRAADVLFVHGLALEAAVANRILGRPLLLKVVGDLAWEQATNRGWVGDGFERFQSARYDARVEASRRARTWWTRRADRVLVPSRYLATWVARWGVPPERIAVVANAPAVPDGIRPARSPVAAPFVLATAGRLVPWKGVDGILDALTALPEAGLVVVGEGPGRAALETRARDLGLSPRVSFAGGRSREETLGLIAGCDLFVLNSAYEGLPHVLLEAMALGRPVLAAAAGGVPEIVHHGENGWLVPVGDAAALVAALRHLAADPQERHRLGAAGQRTAAGFSLERMVAETEALLHHLTR